MQLDLFETLPYKIEGPSKFCKKCDILKPMNSFRLYRRATGDRNSRDSKCKDCSRHANNVIRRLRAISPAPEGRCECCLVETDKLVLDHCHDTEIFRGWLCPPCNLGIGVLGDTKGDIKKALNYLNKTSRKQ